MFKVYNSKRDKVKPFVDNKISTTKYTVLSFIPKNLFYQFSKMSNIYFLLLAFLELLKPISDSNGTPVILVPLSFVVVVSMIKDIFEDLKRHDSDKQENNRKTCVGKVDTGDFEEKLWQDL